MRLIDDANRENRLTPAEADKVFVDPVVYLAGFGIETRLVGQALTERDELPEAA